MKITKEEAIKIASISRIALKDSEIDPLIKQLEAVLSYAERVTQVAAELDDQPSNRNVNFLREDVVVKCDPEPILERAPEREENYFVVPKILDKK
ncbi:MAG: aspartyl-tRNA(Asn)/glutamyl-tRNA(Gln) amidotransferase subunit C [Alteromonas naphthalenivorans]|jgi:aspartyl-tRNA(Asn)/glutamyl-tRNA(Gln) amidotransferase subunit C